MKVGFIGYGYYSKIRASFLEDIENVEILGFYDPYVDNLQEIKKFNDLSELLNDCDAVIISVPPKLAPEYVISALKNECHVFCEKPAAINYYELNKIKIHLRQNLILAYGFNHRLHQSIKKIRKLIQNKELGKVLWLRGRYGKEVDASYKEGWRCNPELNGGGILIDQGIHLIDLISYLVGDIDGVSAVLSNNYLNIPNVEDNGFITLYSTVSKVSASIHTTVTQWRYLFSLEVFFEQGSAVLNGLRTNSGKYGDEVLTIKPNSKNFADDKVYITTEATSCGEEMIEFVRAIMAGTEYPYAKYEDAVETTKLIDKIYRKAIWL